LNYKQTLMAVNLATGFSALPATLEFSSMLFR